jgi:hypothetical protein
MFFIDLSHISAIPSALDLTNSKLKTLLSTVLFLFHSCPSLKGRPYPVILEIPDKKVFTLGYW